MAFCKICACGEKIVFERRLGFPDNCPQCGRMITKFLTYNEDDPRVEEELLQKKANSKGDPELTPTVPVQEETKNNQYVIRLKNGKEISIPDEGGIIGRAELGAEALAEFPSVSRQHIRVAVKRNIGVLIEDISTYGTLVNGQKIVKNEPVRVECGSKITLCNVEAELLVKETSES